MRQDNINPLPEITDFAVIPDPVKSKQVFMLTREQLLTLVRLYKRNEYRMSEIGSKYKKGLLADTREKLIKINSEIGRYFERNRNEELFQGLNLSSFLSEERLLEVTLSETISNYKFSGQ